MHQTYTHTIAGCNDGGSSGGSSGPDKHIVSILPNGNSGLYTANMNDGSNFSVDLTNLKDTFNLQVADTDSVDLFGSGTSLDPLSALLKISPDAGNNITLHSNGVYVPQSFTPSYVQYELANDEAVRVLNADTATPTDIANVLATLIRDLAQGKLPIVTTITPPTGEEVDIYRAISDGTTTTYTVQGNAIAVILENYVLDPSEYTLSGGTVVLSAPAIAWDRVSILYYTTVQQYRDVYTSNGSTLSYATTSTPWFVSVNGFAKDKTSEYTISGNTITFTDAPINGDTIVILSGNGVNQQPFTGDGSTSLYSFTGTFLMVQVNNFVKDPSEYSVSGNLITFNEPVGNGEYIVITTT